MKNKTDTRHTTLHAAWWILLAAAVAAVIVIRIRLLGLPLERDEGEYAYGGQLMLQGIPPYKLAYSMKLPGTAAGYAFFMLIFGESIAGVHLGLLIINLASIALLFFLGRQIANQIGGIVAATSYAILSATAYVLGQAAHATHFVVLPVLGAALLLVRPSDRQTKKTIFAAGTLLGLAVLMKQPGFAYVVFGVLYLGYCDWHTRLPWRQVFRRGGILLLGSLLPLALMCILLWRAGVFPKFWFWTVQYARHYGTRVSISYGIQIFFARLPNVIAAAWPLWAIAGLGLISCALDKSLRSTATFLIGFLLFSLLALCPGFYFRPHYFILLLPAISLLAGAALSTAIKFLPPRSGALCFIPIALFGAALAWPVWTERDLFFERPLIEACRILNGINPFQESVKIADYIRAQTAPGDTIAVLGSEPEIYFYSRRHSATGYIYTYGLMEPQPYAQEMQQEMMREIEAARPKLLVLVAENISWLAGPDSDKWIFKWANLYCGQNYERVGLVNIFDDRSDYYFSGEASNVKPADEHISILRRKLAAQ